MTPSLPSLLTKSEILDRWDFASTATRDALTGRIAVAFLGAASSGKDSAIKALFGVDFGQIDPIPGSTTRAKAITLGTTGQVVIINAPGFGDLRPEVEAEARGLLAHLDVAIYLVNCDGGATVDERKDLDALRALGKPVLVCLNKIDLIRPHQREVFVTTTLAQLGVSREDAVICAFDPLPALAPAPIGVTETILWLHRVLEQDGKGLLLARHLRDKALACESVIASAARRAALAGAIPVPGADTAAVSAVQVKLITDLAGVYEVRLDRDVVLFLLGEMLASTGKGFLRQAVGALKAAGWIPGNQLMELATSALGATLAGAATYGVGKATVAFLSRRALSETGQSKGDLSPDELRAIFDREAVRWQSKDAP